MKFFNKKVRQAIFARPYSFYFILFFFLFIGLNIFINKVYVTGRILFTNLSIGIPFIIFNVLVASLVALNLNLIFIKYKDCKGLNKKGSGVVGLGVFAGLLGGACPGCFAGLFPVFLGLFGVSASLSILPFYGIEIQAVSAVLLMMGAYYISKDNVCDVKID